MSPEARMQSGFSGLRGRRGSLNARLRAYVAAAVTMNDSAPRCGIGWNTLAAVGFVETAHGTYGGVSLTAEGQLCRPIIGPVLNGRVRLDR